MSRLDKIKARADAATKGPWLQDGPWWTDDGGPEPTALPCVVDVDRALVVFPPDAADVGMKRPEDRDANMAFIANARDDVPWLVEQVERLERWKVEACEVMSGLRELGKALGLGLGVQITGPAALAEVARLTAEREWYKDRFPCDGGCVDAPEETCSRHGRSPADLWRIIGEVAAERDALAAAHARESEKVWKVEEVMDDIEGSDPTTWERLRDALSGSEAATSDVDVCSGDADWSVASLTAERDALAAQVARVESLAGQWERLATTAINPNSREWLQACAATLRECLSGWQKMHAALAEFEADTTDTQPTEQECK